MAREGTAAEGTAAEGTASNATPDAKPVRAWSPYRKDDEHVVVRLTTEDDGRVKRGDDAWDPVEKTEYLTHVGEIPPAETLILEVRRHTIDDRREPDRT